MSGALTAIEALLQQPSSEPAAAAAVVVLADTQSPEPPAGLDPALMAVAPRLTADVRAAWVIAQTFWRAV